MEYKIFNKINKYKIPLFIKIIIMIIIVFIGLFLVILTIPGSALIGWFSVIIGLIFIFNIKNIKFLIKIRKGIFYFLKNIHDKQIRNHKIKDIKKHIKDILQNKR